MPTKKKTMYPEDRELKSATVNSNGVLSQHYTTNPSSVIEIQAELSDDVKHDLINAIDEVLAYHKL